MFGLGIEANAFDDQCAWMGSQKKRTVAEILQTRRRPDPQTTRRNGGNPLFFDLYTGYVNAVVQIFSDALAWRMPFDEDGESNQA